MIVWYICTYKRSGNPGSPSRYCGMLDYDLQIAKDRGTWSESEVLGGYAVVKARASEATHAAIAADPLILQIPLASLDASLSLLTAQQRLDLRGYLSAMGYSDQDVATALGSNLAQRTLGEVLGFAASRRLRPRYDAVQDQIVLDGPVQACRPISEVDRDVTEG